MALWPERTRERRARGGLRVWWLHHRVAAANTVAHLSGHALATLLIWVTVGLALALPLFLQIVVVNLEALGSQWDGRPRLNVYFAERAATEAARAQALDWQKRARVAEVRFLSPTDALAEYTQASGLDDVVSALASNPLPAVAVVVPAAEALAQGRIRALAKTLRTGPLVAHVQVDLAWVRRLQAGLDVLRRASWGLAGLLALGVLLVVGQLIGSAVEHQREAIAVMRLLGGSDRFVRRPFLYQGAVYGLGGGVFACLLILLAQYALAAPLTRLNAAYGADHTLRGLSSLVADGWGGMVIVAGAGVIGLLSTEVVLRRRLARLEP